MTTTTTTRMTIATSGKRLTKDQIMAQWRELVPNQDPVRHMQALIGEGSSYGGDGIRICGSNEFVSAVLSRLQDLLIIENDDTRLAVSHAIVQPTNIGGKEKKFYYAGQNVVYIQMHDRQGPFGIGATDATREFHDRRR